MRSSPITTLHDEVLENAQVAARAMPSDELSGWNLLGDAPLLAKAALSYASEISGGTVDVEAVFERTLGMRRWTILQTAIGGRR